LSRINKTASENTNALLATVIEALKDKKAEHIVTLDLTNIDEAVAQYFVICDAQTHIETSAILRNVVEEVDEQNNETPYHVEESNVWSIVDYADVVVHIFKTEDRKFYDLEGAWMDAQRKEYA
jgi:ribosome-associated protein